MYMYTSRSIDVYKLQTYFIQSISIFKCFYLKLMPKSENDDTQLPGVNFQLLSGGG